ncbi:hypothetical protein J1N35_026773 [Gossypium stocksii]|uniref:Uncharacterized protein n=1 Tax=Gossypium stocksii TaxID=47602 RepID=A0A9D3ZXE9_9ROSI|nr:hypothetical protein J1N35_026773 [Gossypium stocksii]
MGVFVATDASSDYDEATRDREMASWAPLQGDLLKCNENFACFEQKGATGPSIAKAFAIREALSWLKSFSLR